MAGKRGSTKFAASSGNIAVLGPRFNGSAFTSIPMAQQESAFKRDWRRRPNHANRGHIRRV